MESDRPSRTAEYNALFRALDLCSPCTPTLVHDPLARRFLSPPFRALVASARIQHLGAGVTRLIDHRWPGVRTSLLARTRLIDSMVEHEMSADTEQLVILGAGFDTRPYRIGALERVPVFEVDAPATQLRKRRVLQRTLGVVPNNVSFVATDFELDDLGAAIGASRYRADLPTLFLWEGVTGYLTPAAVDRTLRWCYSAATAGTVIFTYLDEDVLTHPEHYIGTRQLSATLNKANEPLTFGLRPEHAAAYLHDRGLELEMDRGATEYRGQFFGAAATGMRGHEFYRVALARFSSQRDPVPAPAAATDR